MSRIVEINNLVFDQFAVFEADGITKVSGLTDPADLSVTIWFNGSEVAHSYTLAEIGTSGEYLVTFTPDAEGFWVIEVLAAAYSEIWGQKYDVVVNSWDNQLINHASLGTFGGELATKADVKSSASTESTIAVSGTLVYGTNISGSYTDTQVRDGVYWEVAEVAGDGLTVEMTFNLPSAEHRAGDVSVFGYYTGQPSGSHYIELWLYNYAASAWEQMQEVFLPGGNTSEAEHIHEYGERHVDRSNNNEVKIRLIHNATTYNPSHRLYLDLVEVYGIKVVTADSVAEAVWAHDITSITDVDASGHFVRRALGLMQENIRIDNTTYDADQGLLSSRVRVFATKADAEASTVGGTSPPDPVPIAEYTQTTEWKPGQSPAEFDSYLQVRE